MNWFSKKEKPNKLSQAAIVNERTEDDLPHHGDAPWIQAKLHHDDRFLRQAAQIQNWRRIAALAMFVALFAVGGVIYIGAQSKIVPYLVEVDKLGRAQAVRAVTGENLIKDSRRHVYREFIEFFENTRTVSVDVAANNRLLTKGFSRLSGSAYEYVKTELKKRPPNEVALSRTVQVTVDGAVPISENLWSVEWIETSFNLKGERMPNPERWKANVHFEMRPGGTEAEINHNPLGFFITSLAWGKQM